MLLHGPNPISTPSPDVEMDVDVPEAGEVALTLVTNKKGGKRKAKASSSSLCCSNHLPEWHS